MGSQKQLGRQLQEVAKAVGGGGQNQKDTITATDNWVTWSRPRNMWKLAWFACIFRSLLVTVVVYFWF